ncbi:MAG: phage capsid protein [Bryobacteraceae bacterium]
MSVTVDVAFVTQFDAIVNHLAQTADSVLRGTVRTKSVTGKSFNAERLGPVEMVAVTNRHQATPIVNPEHTRRRGYMADFSAGILLDEEDEIKMLINPKSDYAMTLAMARNRRFDNTVIAAFAANATSVAANDTETSTANLVSFTGAHGDTANHTIANGSTGLTIAKVRQVKRLLDLQEVPESGRHFLTSAYGMEDLLADPQLTSSDFNTLRAMESGTINNRFWMGFTWHFSNLMAIASNIQANYAWHESAIVVGEGSLRSLDISTRNDLNNATQVLAKMSLGAVRVEETKVVACDIDTTA